MRQMTTRCSLVIRLSDGYTGRPPATSAVGVSLQGSMRKPIAKPGGVWVFTDLDGPEATVVLSSAIYREQRLLVRLDELSPLEPVAAVSLLPGPAYPLPSGTTIVQAVITDRAGSPVANERVEADLMLPQASRGRLVADAESGRSDIEVLKTGVLGEGDYYRLNGRDNAHGQVVQILEPLDGVRKYRLANPLTAQASRGDLLMPHFKTTTDNEGRLWMAFRQPMPSDAFEFFLALPDREGQTPIGITLNASVLNQTAIVIEG